MDKRLRDKIKKRSGGWCEWCNERGMRCNRRASDIHHMLTKARGGANLDDLGETYHLLHMCREHHMQSDGQEAYDRGLLIDGHVISKNDKTIYVGTDAYLTERYGQ